MIVIENLSKSFGLKKVLQDITISFEKGKVYGIVGENGSGKTTLFRCIVGLENYQGSVKSDFDNLKDHTGFLQTISYFFPKVTGLEYLRLMCNARNISSSNLTEKNIFDLPLNQYAVTYSTGMKKKLALTGILLQGNDFFILDEPFNGVDIHSNMIITEIIHKLKSIGKTILISSHIFSTLSDTCDEIHLLKAGTFVKKALKDDFGKLDQEMKNVSVGNILEKFEFG